MAIVARPGPFLPARPAVALALAAALAASACDPSPSAAPSGSAPGGTAGPSQSAATGSTGAPACPALRPSPIPWTRPWTERVFYEVFVRSFADGDGDGIGDLAGLTERLDYLNDGDPATDDDLGVTGIWLMPVAESPSYHGYDVVDYTAVESDYGDLDDMRAFVAAAHERGIAVLVDFVINHTSRDHPWFRDALAGGEHEPWYLFEDERPPVARSDGSRVWHEAGGRFYYGYFWEGMPDLDLSNADATAALDAAARFWLDEVGVDGFRLDAAKHLFEDGARLENVDASFDWLAGFRERVHAGHPDALVLGEVFDASSVSARYVREGSLDLTFDFGLAGAIVTALNSRDGGLLASALREVAEAYPRNTLATFLTNHDQNRIASQLSGDAAALRLAAGLLLTGPGTPFVYYGEEIGMTGAKPDERIRTPMRWDGAAPGFGFTDGRPWQPASGDPPGTDVAAQDDDPDSLLSTYRELIRLRASETALRSGDLRPVETSDRKVVAFLRSNVEGAALVVANLGAAAVDAPALTLASGSLCGTVTATSLLGPAPVAAPAVAAGGGFEDYVPVAELGPRELLVIDLASR